MKLCKDCRYCRQVSDWSWKCAHPEAVYHSTDVVTGEEKAIAGECHTERALGKCGMEAKNFEPKGEEPAPAGFV